MILPLGEVLSLIRKGGVLPQGLHLAQVFNLIQGSFGFELLSFRSWLEKMHNAAEGKEANFAGSVSCQPDLLLFISFPKISTVCLGCVVFNWPPECPSPSCAPPT